MKKSYLLIPLFVVLPSLMSCNNSNKVTITWKNEDGTILEIDNDVEKGSVPTYDGIHPSKTATSEHYYSFNGWDHEVTEVYADTTYIATYRDIDVTGCAAYIKVVIPADDEDRRFYFEYETTGSMDVDWGDSTNNVFNNSSYTTHKYNVSGEYDVKIKNINNIKVNSTGKAYATEIYLGNEITTIGNAAFSGCDSLLAISISDSITSIDSGAFNGCSSLTSIYIPKNVATISGSALTKCNSLISVVVDGDNANYDSRDNCNAIITKRQINEIPVNTLIAGCTKTIIPNSVTSIGSFAFQDSSITSINIPDSVTSIGDNAFDHSSLVSIVIPDSVTSIGDNAFNDCSSLTTINIPSNVPTIGSNCFEHCSSLVSISIPNSITEIKDYAFHGCSALTLVDLTAFTNPEGNIPTIKTNTFDIKEEMFKVCNFRMGIAFMSSTGKGWPTEPEYYRV